MRLDVSKANTVRCEGTFEGTFESNDCGLFRREGKALVVSTKAENKKTGVFKSNTFGGLKFREKPWLEGGI